MNTRALHPNVPPSYAVRRAAVAAHFEASASRWAALTSAAPLGRIRQTVRQGRNRMRRMLLSWLPEDLTGARVLDAGCGPGGLAVALARRGADVVAVDVSPALIRVAVERVPARLGPGTVRFEVGDMLDGAWGTFDHVVAMDSLIHYPGEEAVGAIGSLLQRTRRSLVFTFAPRTPALAAMHALGGLLPSRSRAPAIQPLPGRRLRDALREDPTWAGSRPGRTERVRSGFYISQGFELLRTVPDREVAWRARRG
jgi:magnesium-protoporphyrin O-methyltransferase